MMKKYSQAQPGFRSKTWMSSKETNNFQGLYEWDSVEDAKRYNNKKTHGKVLNLTGGQCLKLVKVGATIKVLMNY